MSESIVTKQLLTYFYYLDNVYVWMLALFVEMTIIIQVI